MEEEAEMTALNKYHTGSVEISLPKDDADSVTIVSSDTSKEEAKEEDLVVEVAEDLDQATFLATQLLPKLLQDNQCQS